MQQGFGESEGRRDGIHDDAVAGKPICEGFIGGFADVSKELACVMPCSNRRRVILGSRIPSRNSLVCSTDGRSFFLVDTAVPHCEERPGAAHSRWDQGIFLDPTTVGPTLRGAARRRTLQEGLKWPLSTSGRSGDTMVFVSS